jgi:hypothetical protein
MKNNKGSKITLSAAAAIVFGATAFSGSPKSVQASSPPPVTINTQSPAAAFPYRGAQFTEFFRTSYAEGPAGTPDFYGWMERAYKTSGVRFKGKENARSLTGLLASIKRDHAAADATRRASLEKQTGAFAHKLIKKSIPKFSLDRGFEFYNAVRRGERQCYLQSVLVSGMMQAAGMNAGVVMVSRNEHGQPTNNGHAVTLVKLSDGQDVIVDVSHKAPFARQQGLMVSDARTGQYVYVAPRFAAQGEIITGYDAYEGENGLTTAAVRALPLPFLVSQFDYYRGERAPNGFVASAKTPAGLEASARYLRRAVSEDPRNPLAQYVLGRVYLRQGKTAEARRQIVQAVRLYDSYGFVPSGPRDALALVGAAPQSIASR